MENIFTFNYSDSYSFYNEYSHNICVYDKNKKVLFEAGNVDGIIQLLKMLTKETLVELAKENFLKAASFKKEMLDRKREQFYDEFIRDTDAVKKN